MGRHTEQKDKNTDLITLVGDALKRSTDKVNNKPTACIPHKESLNVSKKNKDKFTADETCNAVNEWSKTKQIIYRYSKQYVGTK